jgi:hypothetical protein
MLRRFLFLAVAVLAVGLGNLEARAGFVPIPTTLDQLLPSGSYTTVAGAETLTFSNFGYSPTAYAGATSPPASSVNVNPFYSSAPLETGITFTSGFYASGAGVLDIAITYVVTAPSGELLNDAYLSIAGSAINGGVASVGETLTNTATGAFITTLTASLPGAGVDSATFAGVQSITVTKDIIMVGNGGFASISVVNQGFSSTTAVPEPTSMALLGIGMAGFFTYRRFFKRPATV